MNKLGGFRIARMIREEDIGRYNYTADEGDGN